MLWPQKKLLERGAASGAEMRAGLVGALAAAAGNERRGSGNGRRSRRDGGRNLDIDADRNAPGRQVDPEDRSDASGLNGVELAYASRHEEALDEAEDPGEGAPEEEKVENTETCAAQIKMVRAKAAKEKSQQNADDLVAAHGLELLVEDGLRIGVIVAAHGGRSLRAVDTQVEEDWFRCALCVGLRPLCHIAWTISIRTMSGVANAALSGEILIGGDLRVRRMGYGTMRIVGDGAWGEPADPEEARRVLRRAVELGVTLIDTADAYGPEIAERLIGETLFPYPKGLVIATKGGITRQGPAKTEYVGRAGYLVQCVEMSLRRLKLECIDLYQLHRIDPRTSLEEQLGALKRMQEQGKIRHIGLSEVTPAEVEEARKHVEVVSIQNRYSLGDRRHEATLDWCAQEGIAFLPWYPNFAGKMLKADHPAAARMAALAARHGASVTQLALAWLLWRSPVLVPIPGTSRVAHLEENVAASALKLSGTEWAEVEAAAAAQ